MNVSYALAPKNRRPGLNLVLASLLSVATLAAQVQPAQAQGREHGRDGGRDGQRDGPRDNARDNWRNNGQPDGRAVANHAPSGRWYDGAHGNNHYYPQPGWAVHSTPARSRVVVWGGVNYRYLDSVWYAPGPRGYVVVRPPFGAVIADRPAFFTLVTIGAIAYLYANGTYYREHAGGYEVVPPPVEGAVPVQVAPAPKAYVYPRLGQSAQQQANDEYECHQWAVSQTGFDPTAAATGQKAPVTTASRDNYQRASGACLDGRGYTVR